MISLLDFQPRRLTASQLDLLIGAARKMSGALVFAERARMQVEKLVFRDIGNLTLSAGVVQIQNDEDARAVLRRADAQLYEAKRAGRNRVEGHFVEG